MPSWDAKNIVAVPFASKWSDLGGDSVWSEGDKDRAGNVTSKAAHNRLP